MLNNSEIIFLKDEATERRQGLSPGEYLQRSVSQKGLHGACRSGARIINNLSVVKVQVRTLLFALMLFSFALTDSGCQSESTTTSGQHSTTQELHPSVAPQIKFATLRQKFGDIFHAERVTRHYVFTNEGAGDLVIKNVRASCGCTKPSFPQRPIPPGASDSISVTYNSVGKQGAQRARIFVQTNDPTQPEVELKLTGHVKVKPKVLYDKEQAERKAKQKKG